MISKLLRIGFSISFIFFSWSSHAQISCGGSPIYNKRTTKSEVKVQYLPRFESSYSINNKDNIGGNRLKLAQYAYRFKVDYNANEYGSWETIENGRRVWRFALSSSGAFSLGIIFSKFKLPKGGQLFIYSNQNDQVLGAYTEKNNKKSGKLSVEPLAGDMAIIEYIEPQDADFTAEIEIGAVLHDYKNIFNLLQGEATYLKSSGTCNVDINCPEGADWQTEKEAVCHILYGGWIATGALVNNTNFDGRPFFLTAHHAINTQDDADIAIFYFNYENSSCNTADALKSQSISGSTLLATTVNLDFTLLELSVMPPAAYTPYYAGWDRSGRVPARTVCIHHPSGDAKKISIDYDSPVTDSYSDTKFTFDANTHWRIGEWDIGTTEGGSSGSPLFDENHRIIGDLTGGEASCSNSINDFYAKFSESWNNYPGDSEQLKVWLDPLNLGVETLDGFDPYAGLRANFIISDDTICINSPVTLADFSTGDPDSYNWDFGQDAVPANSTDKVPSEIVYSSDGLKTVKLIVQKNGVVDSLSNTILVMDYPFADFDYTLEKQTIQIINTSLNAFSYEWNFGDGGLSDLENPLHSYSLGGNYEVNLSVKNVCGLNTTQKEIKTSYKDQLSIYPNPSNGIFTVDLSKITYSQIVWGIYSSNGSLVKNGLIAQYSNSLDVNLNGQAPDIYILNLNVDGEVLKRKLVLVK
ncbi:PKD domain-containing protein [Ancylomarina longa]|uniref:T9SS C-terminal target domain-containing protein n=1 Tax=Ancylomarina longa TaxID=2487017 RepID=A0A434AX48_9BACT|nr:PKD domain-containing protein [Ancylomarina longa]RUT79104.1 T9SS C-terminal target domain-containing protein [Ancylomarina longa]